LTILSVQAVTKRFADRVVFKDVSFRLARGDRAGLVGPNGTGKTTLLHIAAGDDEPDLGNVALARGTRIGFLEQETLLDVAGTVEEHARGAAAHIRELADEMRELEPQLGIGGAEVLDRYAEVQHQFDHAGGYDFDATVKRVLDGLGLGPLARRTVATLSGGERTRLGLARLLLDDPDLLLLDEPTNHLDIAALEWLERFLLERDATILVVSHDRWFLDRVTSRTLSFESGTVVEYRGGYSHYVRQRADREAATARAAERQAEEIARTEEYIRKYGAGQRSKQARGRGKQLARLERIEGPGREAQHTWSLEAAHMPSEAVLTTTALAVGFDRNKPIVRTPPLRVSRASRIGVVGPNGAGKTTLVRTLIGELPALDGYVSSAPTARVAHLAQAQQALGGGTVIESLRSATGFGEQQARDHLARFLFRGEEVLREVAVLSGGERTRLALARLAAREANLLVLDEPTNHLDVAAREALERILTEYQGTQIVISHDRYLIDKLATEVWMVDDGALLTHEGNWSTLQRELARTGGLSALREENAAKARAAGQTARRMPLRDGGEPKKRPTPQPQPARAASRGRKRPTLKAERHLTDLERRIAEAEQRLKELEQRIADVAASGNYMETRRVGDEHASLEKALRELYDEWTAKSEEA
jgi:ATP-binding cassette, subfamily F, member 3